MLHKALVCLLMASMVATSVVLDVGRGTAYRDATAQGIVTPGYQVIYPGAPVDLGAVISNSFQRILHNIATAVHAGIDYITKYFG